MAPCVKFGYIAPLMWVQAALLVLIEAPQPLGSCRILVEAEYNRCGTRPSC
jgi:hypothetical protein